MPPEQRFQHFVILAHPQTAQVFLVHGPQGWSLPHFSSPEQYLGEVTCIHQAVHEQLGLDVTVFVVYGPRSTQAPARSVGSTRLRITVHMRHLYDMADGLGRKS